MIAKLGLLLLMLSAISGCREERDTQSAAAEYRRRLDASGKRVLVTDAQGNTLAKLRKRTAKVKVYDDELVPVGFVSWRDAGGESAPTIGVRPLDADAEQRIARVSDDTFELADTLRIERAEKGWAVFGENAELAGVFERSGDKTWTLRPDYDSPAYEAELDAGKWTVSRDDKTVLQVDSDEFTQLEVLALNLVGLPTLHRVAVGAWMERARPHSVD